ncbi:MAG TPA: protein-L-isoaspartate(D-aspartate) O-methyltransferase [bacterium]|nr:protein-L-isoaspartate(D-aspartate) O-methyltransferase [bacterium]
MKKKIFLTLFLVVILGTAFTPHLCKGAGFTEWGEGQDRFTEARETMVKTQIEARGIKDKRVLRVIRTVPRHRFVLPIYQKMAYSDRPLPIGFGQTISQPYIVALMTESLRLKGDEKVLEIGTGSGYQAAILAKLAKEVYTIEIISGLAKRAEKTLKRLGYENIEVKYGDGYLGWPEYAPFDAIIVTAAPDHIPQPLIDQLAEGGRMIVPVGKYPWQVLKLIQKKGGQIITSDITDVLFVPMTGEEIKKH